MEKIFNINSAVIIIYYDGSNMQEVIDFFMRKGTSHFGKFLQIIHGELHFKPRDYYSREKTLIRPNNYIEFRYDEDDWWCPYHVTQEQFCKNYIKIDLPDN